MVAQGFKLLMMILGGMFDSGDSVVPLTSKAQKAISAMSKKLSAKIPTNLAAKISANIDEIKDATIKIASLAFGLGCVVAGMTLITNPILAGALLNAGMTTSLQVITDCLNGNKSSISSYVRTAAIGAASGAVGGAVTKAFAGAKTVFKVATGAGLSSSATDAVLQLLKTGKVDAKEVIISGATGFALGYAGGKIASKSLNKTATAKAKLQKVKNFFNDEEGSVDLSKVAKGSKAANKGAGGAKNFVDTPFDDAGNLKPNVEYQAGEYKYNYQTDGNGRISNWNTDNLQLTERDARLPHNSNSPGKVSGDHAGHLAGDRFGGSSDLDNIVSQSKDVNLSSYKKIENQWAKAIKEGKDVTVNVDVKYDGSGLRPTEFNVEYTVDGKYFSKDIMN